MISLTELTKNLLKEKSVALFTHMRPDGDTLGSALALWSALKQKGIKTGVYCSDAIPEKFFYLDGANEISNVINEEYDAFVAIDSAEIQRLGELANQFNAHKNTYNIDHHVSNTRFAKVNYVVENASNSENVFAIIKQMNVTITPEIANCLATGVITDTGSLRHKNVTANTVHTLAELFELGANLNDINYRMFTAQSQNRAKLFGFAMSNIRYLLEGKFAVVTVSASDLQKTGASMDETEGFIDFVMGIKGVCVGACLLEIAKDKYKISFRSKGADVNSVAAMFGGGGHRLASGCQIHGEYEEVVDKIRFAVSKYIEE